MTSAPTRGERSIDVPRAATLAAGAILVVAIAVRLWRLVDEPLWFDELVSLGQARGDFGELLRATAADNYPPLHNAVLWLVLHVFGESALASRLPSVVFGVLTVWRAGRLARDLGGVRAELAAMALTTVSPLLVYQSQEGRMYALLALLALLSTHALVRARRAWSPRAVTTWIGWTTLLLYAHYYALFVVLAQAAWIGARWLFARDASGGAARRSSTWRELGRWALAFVAVLALFAPWLPIVVDRTSALEHTTFWIPRPDRWLVLDVLRSWAGPAWCAVLLLGTVAAAPASWGARARRVSEGVEPAAQAAEARVLAWCVAWSVGVPLALSLVRQPIFWGRYTIAANAAALVLAALGIARLCAAARRASMLFIAVTTLLVAAQLPGLVEYYESWHRPDWSSALALMRPGLAPGDRIIAFPSWQRIPLAYHAPDLVPALGAPYATYELATDANARAALAATADGADAGRGALWLVTSEGDHTGTWPLAEDIVGHGRALVATLHVPHLELRRYGPR